MVISGAMAITLLRRRLNSTRRRKRSFYLSRTTLLTGSIAVAVVLSLVVIGGDFLAVTLTRLLAGLTNGAASLLGAGTNAAEVLAADGSAAFRRSQHAAAFAQFSLIGHGFQARFVDDPVVSAFSDLGLIGGVIFLIITLIVPLKICFDLLMRGAQHPFIKFSMCLYFIAIPNLFLSGTAYFYPNWQMVMIFYITVARQWRSMRLTEARTNSAASSLSSEFEL